MKVPHPGLALVQCVWHQLGTNTSACSFPDKEQRPKQMWTEQESFCPHSLGRITVSGSRRDTRAQGRNVQWQMPAG